MKAGEPGSQARPVMSRPLFHADWLRVVFLHYEMAPAALQPLVPFELDTWDGGAYVSLVSFYLENLRSDSFASAGQCLLRPISNHQFLNARTYVRNGGATGIYFLAEWLSKRLAVPLGRPLFGLPYYFGRFDRDEERLSETIIGKRGSLRYEAHRTARDASPCPSGSLDEFLLERYTAFTHWRGLRRFFRVWHEPWPVTPLDATIRDTSLLEQTGGWISRARLVSAHYSPGVRDVWMGHPQLL